MMLQDANPVFNLFKKQIESNKKLKTVNVADEDIRTLREASNMSMKSFY